MRRSGFDTAVGVLAAALGCVWLAGAGCTLRYDFTECETNRDCRRLEEPGSGQFYVCADSVCQAASGIECRTNAHCGAGRDCLNNECTGGMSDAGDAGTDAGMDGGDADASPACQTTRECIDAHGEGWYCAPSGTCKDTRHANCDPVSYPTEGSKDEEVLLLGTIIPTKSEGFKTVGPTIQNGVEMAVLEYFNNAPRNLPGGQVVAHLHCEGGDSQTALESARHLKSLGAPVIVGPLTSGNYIDVVTGVTGGEDDDDGSKGPVTTIAMSGTSPSIANLDATGRTSFQIVANDQFQTSAVVDRLAKLRNRPCEIEKGKGNGETRNCASDMECKMKLGAEYVHDPDNTQRPCKDTNPQVAVFFKDDQYGNDFQSLLTNRFATLYSDATVKYYRYENPAELGFEEARVAQEFASVVSEALGEDDGLPKADQVVFVGTGEAISLAKAYIRAVSNTGKLDPLDKRYVFSHGAAADAPQLFEDLSDDFLEVVEAVAPNIFNQPLYDLWQKRYSVFAGEPVQTSVGGLAYDAAYLGLFAMGAASAEGPVTGKTVAEVIAEGRLQKFGATKIRFEDNTTFPGEARQALGDGEGVDLVGVSGDLDFVVEEDTNRGIVRSNYVGFDVQKRDDVSGTIYELIPTRAYLLTPNKHTGTWAALPGN